MRPSSRLSAQTSYQVADRHSTKAPKRRRASTRSMSVSARSETLSPVPPSRRSMTSSTRISSAVMIIFVSLPAVSTTAATDDSGTDASALAKVNWPASMTSSSTSQAVLGAQPRGGRGAEDVHDAAQAALLVDAELARTAEVDRAQPARAPALAVVGALGRGPAAVGLIEQARRSRRRTGSRSSQGPPPWSPASRTVTFPVATWTRTVRPTLPAVAVAVTGMPARRELRAHGGLVARADLQRGARGEHLRAADEDGLQRVGGARRAAERRRSARAPRGRRTWPAGRRRGRPSRAARRAPARRHGRAGTTQRQADARAQADADEHVARGRGRGELAHADHDVGRGGCRQVSHRGRSGAAARRRPRASGSSRKDSGQASPSTSSSESSSSADLVRRRCGRRARLRRSRRACRACDCRRAQVELEAGHRGERADVGADR